MTTQRCSTTDWHHSPKHSNAVPIANSTEYTLFYTNLRRQPLKQHAQIVPVAIWLALTFVSAQRFICYSWKHQKLTTWN